jgi:hypothetical protein
MKISNVLKSIHKIIYAIKPVVTFNNISGGQFYWWRKPDYPEKATNH